jgi:hypothetical protein
MEQTIQIMLSEVNHFCFQNHLAKEQMAGPTVSQNCGWLKGLMQRTHRISETKPGALGLLHGQTMEAFGAIIMMKGARWTK